MSQELLYKTFLIKPRITYINFLFYFELYLSHTACILDEISRMMELPQWESKDDG